jgi:SAM-dependent methyltransferase
VQPETYQMLAARQTSYWWHRARRKMAVALLRRHGLGHGARWLDLGCGPGGNLRMLDALEPDLTVGIDLSPLAIEFARQAAPDAAILRADIARGLPIRDASIDLVTIFNVLCHSWVASEVAVLREVHRVLRPGGLLLTTEPAFAALFREMDIAAMAIRRYRRAEFTALCRGAGFEVNFCSYFTSFGFPILLALKGLRRLGAPFRRGRKRSAADMVPLRPHLNEALHVAAALEASVIGVGLPVPFGTTLVCIARRV